MSSRSARHRRLSARSKNSNRTSSIRTRRSSPDGALSSERKCAVPLVGTHHTFYDDYLKHVKLDYPWGKKFTWKYTIAYYNRADVVTSPSRALGVGLHEHGLTRELQVMANPVNVDFSSLPRTAQELPAQKDASARQGKR